MSFQDSLDKFKVENIPVDFVDVMDSVIGPAIITGYASPAPLPPFTTIPVIGAAALAAKTGAPPDAADGAALLFTNIVADISTLIVVKLAAGFATLATPSPIGVPGGPIAPIKLAIPPPLAPPDWPIQGLKFGKATLDFAISLLPIPDPRINVPFVISP